MVPGCHSGKEKKQKKVPPNRMINQNFLKLLINTFKNFSQNNFQTLFSEKVKNGEDEILVDMVASELKSLSCSILKVKFKHEVNNLFFKYQKVNYKKMLTQIPNPISTQHLLTYNSPPPSPSQSNGTIFLQNTNRRSLDCQDTSMCTTQWNN